jgi:asparagine synthase (glutamine-hydrolysing)
VFRRAIRDLVPPAVLDKPKQGFAVPLDTWFLNELGDRVDRMLEPSAPVYEYLDGGEVKRLVAEHRRGRRDHSHAMWRIIVLDIWLRQLQNGKT